MLDAVNIARRTGPVSKVGGASVTPLPAASRFSLRLKETALADLGPVAGLQLDGPINHTVQGPADRFAIRLGPDEWLIVGPEEETDFLAAEIGRTLGAGPHSLVDISHRNVAFEVNDGAAEEIVNSGCPLDLHLSAFPIGYGTRTLLGKSEIVLVRLGVHRFRVECWRSFAEYVHTFLTTAATSARLIGSPPP